MSTGWRRLSRRQWYHNGGFSARWHFRRMVGGAWQYYVYN